MDDPQEDKEKVHQPEYIILDAEENGGKSEKISPKQLEFVETINFLSTRKFSFGLRLLLLISALFVFLALFFVGVMTLITACFAMLALFKSEELNRNMIKSWGYLKKTLTILIGLILGFFSPVLGLSLILVYLMIHGENLQNTFFSKVFTLNKNK